ncbi:MAG: MFS transporter [Parachlamydiales bacterium]
MFIDNGARRSYIAVLVTYALDLIGFSIVFPVLAPLFLHPMYGFFPAETSELFRTTMLGVAFALFSLAQFFAAPMLGAAADHIGRRKVFLITIALSVVGYGVLALSVMWDNLWLLLLGRLWTGSCSGNAAIAQSAVADIAYPEHRAKAFGYLNGIGGVGFVVGPFLGGLLAEPEWLGGSIPFLFVGAVSILNLLIVYAFFSETYLPHAEGPLMKGLVRSFRNLHLVFQMPALRTMILLYFVFLAADSMFLTFLPTYFVQRFNLKPDLIGDIYAYTSIIWMVMLLVINRELLKWCSLRVLSLWGSLVFGLSVILMMLMPNPWWILPVLVPAVAGAALAYSNMGAMVSHAAPPDYQGRALGASTSALSLSQIAASLLAGPLAGLNDYLPLSVGAACALLTALLLTNRRCAGDT